MKMVYSPAPSRLKNWALPGQTTAGPPDRPAPRPAPAPLGFLDHAEELIL